MAKLKPFRAWRPRPDVSVQVASPPYDVLSSAEAREMASDNPLSFLHVVKPEIDLEPGTDVYAAEVYATGAANLRRLVDDGVLVREEEPLTLAHEAASQLSSKPTLLKRASGTFTFW